MLAFQCCICPKVFLSEIPEKLSEVFLPKVFGPKVVNFNVAFPLVSDLPSSAFGLF